MNASQVGRGTSVSSVLVILLACMIACLMTTVVEQLSKIMPFWMLLLWLGIVVVAFYMFAEMVT